MKKIMALMVFVVLCAFLPVLFGAISIDSFLQPENFGWAINAAATDVSSTEQLVEAPTSASDSLYLRQLTINCVDTASITIGINEVSSNVGSSVFGPVYFAASGTTHYISHDFIPAVKLPAGASLSVDSSVDVPIHIFVSGFTQ